MATKFRLKLLTEVLARGVVIFWFLAVHAISVQAFENPSDSLIKLQAGFYHARVSFIKLLKKLQRFRCLEVWLQLLRCFHIVVK